jgi:hypothetical protein
MAYRNVRPVVAELACVMVNEPLATALMNTVPLPTSTAALAVVGVRSVLELRNGANMWVFDFFVLPKTNT